MTKRTRVMSCMPTMLTIMGSEWSSNQESDLGLQRRSEQRSKPNQISKNVLEQVKENSTIAMQ